MNVVANKYNTATVMKLMRRLMKDATVPGKMTREVGGVAYKLLELIIMKCPRKKLL